MPVTSLSTLSAWLRPLERLRFVGVTVAVVATADAAATTNWIWLAAGVAVLAGAAIGDSLAFAGLLVAFAVGSWPAMIAGVLGSAAWLTATVAGRMMVGPLGMAGGPLGAAFAPRDLPPDLPSVGRQGLGGTLDDVALAAAVTAVPAELRRRLGELASSVSTDTMLRAAVADDPVRWASAASTGRTEAFEGGPLGDTGWTVAAAETALMATCRPNQLSPIDLHLLAGLALLVPHSAAQVRYGDTSNATDQAKTVVGLSTQAVTRILVATCMRPGGELLMARVERLSSEISPKPARELSERQWLALLGAAAPSTD